MTHAFFADMGGFLVQAPDSPEFPLDAEQLYYLVTKKLIEYPSLTRKRLRTRTKQMALLGVY